jgi:predicted aspartyl protease
VMQYPYKIISSDPAVPPAPIITVTLSNPNRSDNRIYELDAFLDTGADGTLIPLEVVSMLRLPLLDGRVPIAGVGGAITRGFPCQMDMQLAGFRLSLLEVIACEAAAIGDGNQMIIGRDILNQFCVKFDGKNQRVCCEVD